MQGRESRDPSRVGEMFGRIANRYDLLNHLLSANLDRGWRRAAARQIPAEGSGRVLDLCSGTGDLAVDLVRLRRARVVVCCDFAHPMLVLARAKFARRRLRDRCIVLEADGLRLPFEGGTFDAVTVGFGVRNFANLVSGLQEAHRVLRPGGRLVILEFSRPAGRLVSRLYGFYLQRVLPRLGDGLGGGRGAYRYLARTIADFPEPTMLARQLRDTGFAACDWVRLAGGIVAIHTGRKEGVRCRPSGEA
jgi:demethylmenaquinone methyltransferase/2-methoxy-6-polyprenyl-1,4-benzoquinol methylase